MNNYPEGMDPHHHQLQQQQLLMQQQMMDPNNYMRMINMGDINNQMNLPLQTGQPGDQTEWNMLKGGSLIPGPMNQQISQMNNFYAAGPGVVSMGPVNRYSHNFPM